MSQTLIDGFEKFVVRNPIGCWGWNGCAPKNPGYGQFRSNMKIERAHRASWKIYYGDIPHGMFVLHRCDNKICSNPEHLFLGMQSDNICDAFKKNRNKFIGASGEKNHMAKLKYEDVKRIRKFIAQGIKQVEIARFFNVHPTRISDIKLGRTWSGTTSRSIL